MNQPRQIGPTLIVFACSSILWLAGCQVGPDYHPADVSATTTAPWRAQSIKPSSDAPPSVTLSSQIKPVANWWEQFNDPQLVKLIEQVGHDQPTLIQAQARIAAARAVKNQAGSGQLPVLDATGDLYTAGTGSEAVNFRGPPPGQRTEVYSMGMGATWELDLWGRVARLTRAADANIDFAIEDYHAAAVSIAADIATVYIDLRATQARLKLLDQQVEVSRQTLALTQSLHKAGSASAIATTKVQQQLAQLLARRPGLTQAIARSENRIALLLGQRPTDGLIAPGPMPQLPHMIGLGLPADLLTRRPDIRRATAAYRAAVERIGAAKAQHYPTVMISGTLNLQSTDIGNLFGGHAWTYNLGPSLRLPLFEGGRIDALVHQRVAEAQAQRAAVKQTLLQAIEEVENAAVGVVRLEDQQHQLDHATAAAAHTLKLTTSLQQSGLGAQLDVLDAQANELNIQDQQLVVKQNALAQAVALYRALGGGWRAMTQAKTEPPSQANHVESDQ